MKRIAPALAVAAAALAGPATAGAATVSVGFSLGSSGPTFAQEIRFDAGPGEANRLAVTVTGPMAQRQATFTDPGATITGGEGCTVTPDGHSATCAYVPGVVTAALRAMLGDGSDTLQVQPGAIFTALVADGGPGDDTITGGPEPDTLDGGGGKDTLRGGDGDDVLNDDDYVDGIDADTLDGGGGTDRVDYSSRMQDVAIDLDGTTTANGSAGEGDTLSGIESADGGYADDQMHGGGGVLRGGDGDDDLSGARAMEGDAGDDLLENTRGTGSYARLDGGPGADRLRGGAATSTLAGGAGYDRFTCGTGREGVDDAQARELLTRACEGLAFTVPGNVLSLPPTGRLVRRRGVRQPVQCQRGPESPIGARGKLTLRQRGGRHRRLGQVAFRCAGRNKAPKAVRVRLTGRGARLAHRGSGVLVTVRVKTTGYSALEWSYRLR